MSLARGFPAYDPEAVFATLCPDLPGLKARLKFDTIKDPYGLTDHERLALWLYTSAGGLGVTINEGLWRRSLQGPLAAVVPILDGALQKLPRWTKPIYRGYHDGAPAFFALRYQQGRVRSWPGFTSTSVIAEKAFRRNVLFTISSRHGRQVMHYSSEPSEDEVILPRDWHFKCLGMRQVDGFTTVTLVDAV